MARMLESDPRLSGIEYQLSRVKRIFMVLSVKGGVGKSTVSALLGLALADKGASIGLLDVDFANPSLHTILGAPADARLEEEMGVKPYQASERLYILSPVFFAGDSTLPLRGLETVDALLELLTIGNWGSLDALVIDTPPGLGDAQLTLFKILKNMLPGRSSALVVSTPSTLSIKSLERSLPVAEEILGVEPLIIVNMATTGEPVKAIGKYRVLGSIRYDEGLEKALGSPAKLRRTLAYSDTVRLAEQLL